jgi:hypothetical protein
MSVSTNAEAFEETVLTTVVPEICGQDAEGTVRACGLFSRREEDPAQYLCRVVGEGATGERLERAAETLTGAGAEGLDIRQFDEVGCVPDEATVDAAEQEPHPLLVCRVRLEHTIDREGFERLLLDDVLRADVELGPTRTNMFASFRLHRDESPSRLIDHRYVIEARGSFFFPGLFPGTVERIEQAGAQIADSTVYDAVLTERG